MVDLISRTSSDPELDIYRLNSVLDSISSDLEIPFLEKRARAKSHKKSPLEELNFVIQELTNRERELQAAVGIAKMLIQRNNDLVDKLKSTRTKKRYYKSSIRELKDDNNTLKTELISADEKYQQVNSALVSAEEQQIGLLAEYQRLIREYSSSKPEGESKQVSPVENDLGEYINKYKEQAEYLKRNKLELERTIENLQNEKGKSEDEFTRIKEENFKLDRELQKSQTKVKEFEESFRTLEDLHNQLETQHKILTHEYTKLSAKAYRLEEDLQISENSSHFEQKKNKSRRHISLMSEFAALEPESPINSPNLPFQVISPTVLNLAITPPSTIASINAKKSKNTFNRKAPLEEYFTLTTQAVKLNSPYLDAICAIPSSQLYQQALSGDIPFHRWHVWIEGQLTSSYIQTMYQTQEKSKSIF